ncbi:hypothetical protein Tco_0261705 [Tanacetum coccineum]
MMEVISDEEEVAVDAISLATKPPSIVDWNIIKEGKIGYYQIIRANGNSRRYSSMIQMLKSFDKEDLETLWKLVKAKHGYTRPEEGYERVLWGESRQCFKHHNRRYISTSIIDNNIGALFSAAESLVYIRKSAAKTKDKEEFDEEERQRIARVHEAARSFSEQLKRLSFNEIKDLFETTMRRANTFIPMETEIRRGVIELVADSSKAAVTESAEARGTKRAAEEEVVFKDMLKTFNRDDLVKLCSLVQERFNSTEPTEDKEIEFWVELKRLFEPDADDEL